MIIGSLFSGIGGFELGLSRGLGASSVAWQVELDPWCRQVLERHWPDAARHDDVRAVGAHNLAPVDVLCGGFPCQDISTAGAGAGLAGARSGLWFEMLRVIREMQPRYVVAENVAALRARGLPVVLAGLREAGYVPSWAIISAADLGAPHQRRRLWIVAYRRDAEPVTVPAPGGVRDDVWPRGGDPEPWERGEPRVSVGVPDRRKRLHALGNAVVPQVPELIGQAIANAGAFTLVAQGGGSDDLAWPTPTAHNKNGAAPSQFARNDLGLQCAVVAPHLRSKQARAEVLGLKSWPTPSASDDRDRGRIDKTPAIMRRHAMGKQLMLSMVAVPSRQWPTPTAHNAKEGGHPAEYNLDTPTLTAQVIGDPTQRGTLSPRWVELLMGYPLDWTTP